MKKRLLAMALMCLTAISLLTSAAFAAGSNGTNEKSVLYPNSVIKGLVSCRTTDFTASADNGHFIQYWFKNSTGSKVRAYLYRTDRPGDPVSDMEIAGNSQKAKVYYDVDSNKATYYVVLEDATGTGAVIEGRVSVAQYQYGVCPDCGGATELSPAEWSETWLVTGHDTCAHYMYGDDFELTNHGTLTAKCIDCEKGSAAFISRTKTDCKGSNYSGK